LTQKLRRKLKKGREGLGTLQLDPASHKKRFNEPGNSELRKLHREKANIVTRRLAALLEKDG